MGLIWSSGLSELQGEKDFSARILAICGGQEELSRANVAWLFLLPPTPKEAAVTPREQQEPLEKAE